MVLRNGRYGSFYACSRYPECKFTKPLAQETPGICPKCGSTNIDKLQRITGYLVGTTDRWNRAKLAELNDRVVHE